MKSEVERKLEEEIEVLRKENQRLQQIKRRPLKWLEYALIAIILAIVIVLSRSSSSNLVMDSFKNISEKVN